MWLQRLVPFIIMVCWLTFCCYFFSRQLIPISLLKVCNDLNNYHETAIHKDIKAHKMHMDVFKIVNNTKKFAKYKYKLRQSFVKSIKENKFSHYNILCENYQQKSTEQKEHYFCHSGGNNNNNEDNKSKKKSRPIYHTISCNLNYPISLNMYFLNENIHFKHIKCYLMWFNK